MTVPSSPKKTYSSFSTSIASKKPLAASSDWVAYTSSGPRRENPDRLLTPSGSDAVLPLEIVNRHLVQVPFERSLGFLGIQAAGAGRHLIDVLA